MATGRGGLVMGCPALRFLVVLLDERVCVLMLFFLLLGGLWLLIATGHPPDLFGWLMAVGAGYVCGFVEARWVVGRRQGGDSVPLPDQPADDDLGNDVFATR